MRLKDYHALRAMEKSKRSSRSKKQAKILKYEVDALLREFPWHEEEVRFHDKRRWRFDYAWPDSFVALEIHGGVFSKGRHTRGKGFTEDRVKMNSAQLLGWIVIEATTDQVKQGLMVTWLRQAFKLRKEQEKPHKERLKHGLMVYWLRQTYKSEKEKVA
ncbi:MAG: hypothetical protein HRU25_07970 [Psychrobium sp.]|nr:hypothetical protein [Psychrobium sp.]